MTDMRRFVYDEPARVCEWVSARIFGEAFGDDATAIGLEEDGELIGGVVYTHYCGTDIRMHIAGEGHWLSRGYLYRAFAYPFEQLGCRRVSGLVRMDNDKAIQFDEKLGFRCEGVLREADEDGCDLLVFGMLQRECRWLNNNKKKSDGKKVKFVVGSTA